MGMGVAGEGRTLSTVPTGLRKTLPSLSDSLGPRELVGYMPLSPT